MIIIDPEFKSLIPPLATEEYSGLEASVISDGCRDALKLWLKAYFLINGREGQPEYQAIMGKMKQLEKEEKR